MDFGSNTYLSADFIGSEINKLTVDNEFIEFKRTFQAVKEKLNTINKDDKYYIARRGLLLLKQLEIPLDPPDTHPIRKIKSMLKCATREIIKRLEKEIETEIPELWIQQFDNLSESCYYNNRRETNQQSIGEVYTKSDAFIINKVKEPYEKVCINKKRKQEK